MKNTKRTIEKALFWKLYANTGMSSETMLKHFLNQNDFPVYEPYDSSDFRRCVGLLTMIPEWKKRLPEIAKLSATWRDIIHNWDYFVTLLKEIDSGGKNDLSEQIYNLHYVNKNKSQCTA